MKALRIFLVPWLPTLGAAVPGTDCAGLDAFDGSVLLHRDLQLHAPAIAHLPLTPSEAFSELAHRAVLRASEHTQTFETRMEAERKEIQALREYLEKVYQEFGKPGTFFGELHGLLPAGPAGDADRKMGERFLVLLRDDAFAKALHTGVQDVGRAVLSYSSRTEKRVQQLLLSSANTTEEQLPQLINSFFLAQQHIVSTLVEKMESSLQKVLFAIPEEHSYIQLAAGPLLKELVDRTSKRVAREVGQITGTNGTSFCAGADAELVEQVLPMMNATVRAMPALEAFAQSNMPDVAPAVKKVVKQLTEVSRPALASLQKQARGWTEQVCSLVAAASPAS